MTENDTCYAVGVVAFGDTREEIYFTVGEIEEVDQLGTSDGGVRSMVRIATTYAAIDALKEYVDV